jgi:hypothetical protein
MFATLSEKSPKGIWVRLTDFSSELGQGLNDQFYIRIVDGDGSNYDLTAIGEEVQIFYPGDVKLEVRGDLKNKTTMPYEGKLMVTPPDIVDGGGVVEFKGKVLTYDLPEAFSKTWYNGKNFSCTVIDTGDLETSEYDCHVTYPISIDISTMAFPTSPADKQLEDEKTASIIGAVTREKNEYKYSASGAFALLLIALGVLIFATKIYPKFRARLNTNS